jgi:uncharacterized metal-binding protein YceD (DUF177 family)
MIKLRIRGIKDGEHIIEERYPAEKIKGIYPEFKGDVLLEGKLRKLGKRYSFVGTARSVATLVCDRSLQEFDKEIEAEIKISFLADSDLFTMIESGKADDEEITENVVHEDDSFIDLDEEISEELAVSIPMKRVSPEYEDLDIEDIYPEHSKDAESKEDNDQIDERWEKLKKLKLN